MPIIIPTPDEVARMGKRERDAWRRRLGVTMRQAQETRRILEYGEVTMDQARHWERLMGRDPEWQRHQAELIAALK